MTRHFYMLIKILLLANLYMGYCFCLFAVCFVIFFYERLGFLQAYVGGGGGGNSAMAV